MATKKYKVEREMLAEMIAKAPAEKQKALQSIADHVAFVKIKLDEAKKQCEKAGIVIEYNNGGGQSGIRENPLIKSYANLLKLYLTGMTQILNAIPESDGAAQEPTATPLEIILAKRKAAASE